MTVGDKLKRREIAKYDYNNVNNNLSFELVLHTFTDHDHAYGHIIADTEQLGKYEIRIHKDPIT